MDRIIKEEGFEARKLPWNELGFEVGLENIANRTIVHAMGNAMRVTEIERLIVAVYVNRYTYRYSSAPRTTLRPSV
jgi:hypothetical protein